MTILQIIRGKESSYSIYDNKMHEMSTLFVPSLSNSTGTSVSIRSFICYKVQHPGTVSLRGACIPYESNSTLSLNGTNT